MKNILSFSDYINEAYLKGSRQPLYHNTTSLSSILRTNELRRGTPTRGYEKDGKKMKSISLSRNMDYSSGLGNKNDIENFSYPFLELDIDKLHRYGYISTPFDEVGYASRNAHINFSKANFNTIKQGRRYLKHNIKDLEDKSRHALEIEYEERIYKDIKNLGRYLISINIEEKSINNYLDELEKYLEKYPHIKVYTYPKGHKRNRTLITIKELIKQD